MADRPLASITLSEPVVSRLSFWRDEGIGFNCSAVLVEARVKPLQRNTNSYREVSVPSHLHPAH